MPFVVLLFLMVYGTVDDPSIGFEQECIQKLLFIFENHIVTQNVIINKHVLCHVFTSHFVPIL